jgi:uncharacterized spore protein YtfJ
MFDPQVFMGQTLDMVAGSCSCGCGCDGGAGGGGGAGSAITPAAY